jgi:hypothetical protein
VTLDIRGNPEIFFVLLSHASQPHTPRSLARPDPPPNHRATAP